jgi:hypothetical protein
MKKDGIMEISTSTHINPLCVVLREGICLDARRVNKFMSPDRAKVQPINELLQRFHGSIFISSIAISSAFLQIELAPESRRYTAFLFESQVYQFTRTPYGFRNSSSSFVRALQSTLGSETTRFALCYVDDITVFSQTYELHPRHLETVIGKLTGAGFTINAVKCNFCKPEIAFLGHVISDGGVFPDPGRIAAILNYPAPKNQRESRQFLGVCNYHHRFIINFASFAAPLLPLLKKGNKWKWTPDIQSAFETLRSKFADSIYLVHPDVALPYSIDTDASNKAVRAMLKQTGRYNETRYCIHRLAGAVSC